MVEYISDSEVASILGVARSTICKLWHNGPKPNANFDLRDCEPVICGRVRRWRKDFVLLCLAHRPVPTDTWRKRHEAADAVGQGQPHNTPEGTDDLAAAAI